MMPNSIRRTLREKKSAQKHSLASLIATSHDWSQQFVSPYPDLPITTIRQCSNKNARLRFSGCGLTPDSTEFSNGPSHKQLPGGGLGHFRILQQQRSATASTALHKRIGWSARFLTKKLSFFCTDRWSRRASHCLAVAFRPRTSGRKPLLRRPTAGPDPKGPGSGTSRAPPGCRSSTAFSGGLQSGRIGEDGPHR